MLQDDLLQEVLSEIERRAMDQLVGDGSPPSELDQLTVASSRAMIQTVREIERGFRAMLDLDKSVTNPTPE